MDMVSSLIDVVCIAPAHAPRLAGALMIGSAGGFAGSRMISARLIALT
jgi:hypothetical protein